MNHEYFQSLNSWYRSPLGETVAKQFRQTIEPFSEQFNGSYLVQMGCGGDNLWLDQFKYQYSWILSSTPVSEPYQVQCLLNQTPFPKNTVDCVVVPLTMELFSNKVVLLDEIDRILKPMGFVVFCCFNPWSVWGAALKTGMIGCYSGRNIHMTSAFHLNRLLVQRGYRQCALTHLGYIPPVNNQSVINQLQFLNQVGKMLWPFPSGLYCYIAQKYETAHPNAIVTSLSQIELAKFKQPALTAINRG